MGEPALMATCTIDEMDAVGIITFANGPGNSLDAALAQAIAEALEEVDRRPHLRASVLVAQGKHFCSGARLGGDDGNFDPEPIYRAALAMFRVRKPIVAAVQGAVIGGGLGLALAADFRIVSAETRLSANFVRLGIHPGFGLTVTLPRLIGAQRAALLFLSGRRISGEDAVDLGLADELAVECSPRERAIALAGEIARGAPLAVEATRGTLRAGLVDSIDLQLTIEIEEQRRLFRTVDFREGVAAVGERRPGHWSRA